MLAKQLFLDLIRFMLERSLYLSLIPEIVFSSRERIWVEKLCSFGIFKIGIFIKQSIYIFLKSFWQFGTFGTGFYRFQRE